MTPINTIRMDYHACDTFTAMVRFQPEAMDAHTSIVHEHHTNPFVSIYDVIDNEASVSLTVHHAETITILVRRGGEIAGCGIFETSYLDGELTLRPCVTVNLALSRPGSDASAKSPLSQPLQAYAGNMDTSKTLADDIAHVLQRMPKSNRSVEKEAVVEEVQA